MANPRTYEPWRASGRAVRLLVDSRGRLTMKVGYPKDAHCWTKTELSQMLRMVIVLVFGLAHLDEKTASCHLLAYLVPWLNLFAS